MKVIPLPSRVAWVEPGEVRGQGWLLFPNKYIFICSSQINITLPDGDLHEPRPQSSALNALPSLMEPGLPLQNKTQKPNCLLSISSKMSELDFCIQSRTPDPPPHHIPHTLALHIRFPSQEMSASSFVLLCLAKNPAVLHASSLTHSPRPIHQEILWVSFQNRS